MGNKMLMANTVGCQLYFETDDGNNIILEVDDPQYFEASNFSIKVQIPLDRWNYIVEDYREKYFKYLKSVGNADERQMQLL